MNEINELTARIDELTEENVRRTQQIERAFGLLRDAARLAVMQAKALKAQCGMLEENRERIETLETYITDE